MARRASSGINLKLLLPIVGGVILLVIVFLVISNRSGAKKTSQANFPIDDYIMRGSALRNNEYIIEGKVVELMESAIGEVVNLQINQNGKISYVAIFLRDGSRKGVNLEREQKYSFHVKVENQSNNKGLIFATQVQPL